MAQRPVRIALAPQGLGKPGKRRQQIAIVHETGAGEDVLPHHYRRIAPYLYSPDQITTLMAAAGRLAPPLRAATWQTLIGLLAVTGMRKSEACHLDRDQVDLAAGVLTITDTKFEALVAAAQAAGYPKAGDETILKKPSLGGVLSDGRALTMIGLLFILVLYVTMVYGPIAALLVELFPTRIRYTGMSLPYHIGNGWFGGFLPPTAFAIVAASGNIFAGLWYPVIFALITAVVGFFFVPETKDVDITKM